VRPQAISPTRDAGIGCAYALARDLLVEAMRVELSGECLNRQVSEQRREGCAQIEE